MRQLLCVVAAMMGMVGFSVAARGDDAAAAKPVYYVIKCRVVQYDADGQKSNVQKPTITTEEGRPASFFVGQEKVFLGPDNKQEFQEIGTSTRLVVRGLKGGKVRLDATSQFSWLEPAANSDLRMRSVSSRSIETIRLGEVFHVELESGKDDGSGRTLELTVEKADAAAK